MTVHFSRWSKDGKRTGSARQLNNMFKPGRRWKVTLSKERRYDSVTIEKTVSTKRDARALIDGWVQ